MCAFIYYAFCFVDDLKYWLETIRCYGTDNSFGSGNQNNDPPVFIVGTHKDKFEVSLKTALI